LAGSVLVVGALLAGLVAPAQGESQWPQHRWPAAVVRVADGVVTLGVTQAGKTVLEPARVGIVTEQADLSQGLREIGRTVRPIIDHYRTTVGKRLSRHVFMTETTYRFEGAGGARLDLVVRQAPDGVAYRYVLPKNYGAVLGEASTFKLPAGSTAWLARYRRDYENPYLRTTAGGADVAEFMHPALFDVDGTYALLTESDVDGRYSGGRLVHQGGGEYRIGLWDPKVLVGGPLATPWRVAIVGSLATVAQSNLVDDLAPSSRISDTSWIKPGPALWTWLAGGRSVQQNLKRQKEFVDYAAARGWPYVVVDAGWYDDPNWRRTSWMPELVRYAEARHVSIHTWVRFASIDTPEERADMLPLLAQWGVTGLKIDFMDSDGQERYRWYDEILPETAALRFLINFHGATLPHGFHRTWPHVMTTEAVHGAEKSSGVTTSHLTALPFTRNVVGGMDFTPGAFQRVPPARQSTDGHELALSVIFESGVQNLAGTIAAYEARSEARWFLEQVPTAWDETKLLSGRPGESAVFARRSGDRWFIGAGVSGAARSISVDLPGDWLVEIVKDSPAGLVREQRTEPVSVDVPADGGFAAIACRWRPGIQTCAVPVNGAPSTSVTAAPASGVFTPGTQFEVTGKFTNNSVAVSDVVLAPRVPAGWRVLSDPVRAPRVQPGQTIDGKWTVVVGPEPVGQVDVPVVASFRADFSRRPFESSADVRAHVWRPLGPGQSYVSDLPITSAARDTSIEGTTLTVGGARFGKGLGVNSPSDVSVAVAGKCREFRAEVGVDDEVDGRVDRAAAGGTVAFALIGDGRVLAQTSTLRTTDAAAPLVADITGVQQLTLRVTDGGDGTSLDHASWGDARLTCA
jgi:alpha-glucosidase